MDPKLVDRSAPTRARPRAFAERLALLVVHTGALIAAHGNDVLEAELGLSGQEYTALALIERDQPSSQAELARLMGKTPAACVALLDDLEESGLAQRVRDPKDRRRTIVTLTDHGRTQLTKGDDIAVQIEAKVLGDLTTADRAELLGLLGGTPA